MTGYADVELALKLAVEKHFSQRDKVGEPYIFHVLRVWQSVRNEGSSFEAQIVALLHDIVEDTTFTLDEVFYVFGAEIGNAVDAITKRANEPLDSYLSRVKSNDVARLVKRMDSRDNFHRLDRIGDEATRDRLSKKYLRVFEVLAPTAPAAQL